MNADRTKKSFERSAELSGLNRQIKNFFGLLKFESADQNKNFERFKINRLGVAPKAQQNINWCDKCFSNHPVSAASNNVVGALFNAMRISAHLVRILFELVRCMFKLATCLAKLMNHLSGLSLEKATSLSLGVLAAGIIFGKILLSQWSLWGVMKFLIFRGLPVRAVTFLAWLERNVLCYAFGARDCGTRSGRGGKSSVCEGLSYIAKIINECAGKNTHGQLPSSRTLAERAFAMIL